MRRAMSEIGVYRRSGLPRASVRLSVLVLFTFALSACGTGNSAKPTLTLATIAVSPPPAVSPSESPGGALDGTWDTGQYETTAYPGHSHWETRVTFYVENGVPFVTMAGWDPTEGVPSPGDHGPYHLRPDGQLAIASADQPEFFTVYAYQLTGDDLSLTWLHNDPNGPDASDTTGPFTTIRLHRQ
jgi:hypothetical protein